jgi:hypothetical protein
LYTEVRIRYGQPRSRSPDLSELRCAHYSIFDARQSSTFGTAELYDPVANTWTFTGNLTAPLGRYAHTSTLLPDGTVLLAGGEGATISCGKACTSSLSDLGLYFA